MLCSQLKVTVACTPEKAVLFPTFARLAQKILLLPIGTATVERSFSTLNRILNCERCRLLPNHVDMLTKISIEGPEVPDVRSSTHDRKKDVAADGFGVCSLAQVLVTMLILTMTKIAGSLLCSVFKT